MSIKQIRVCDSCGKELKYPSEIYHICHIDFESEIFMDAAGSRDYNFERIDLCADCVHRVVEALETIAKK